MKSQLNKILTVVVLLLVGTTVSVKAQTLTTPNVKIFCDGADLNLGAVPIGVGTNPEWRVRFSASPSLTSEQLNLITPLVLTGGTTITAGSLQTGYFYISTIAEDACESLPEIIPVYKFAPLTAAITGADDYCEEDPKAFTATPTTTDAHTIFTYQWYTFDGTTETAISGATNSTFTPTGLTAGNTTSYKVRIGYLVGTTKYCSNLSAVEAVTVTAKPTKPTITVEGVTGETW